MAEKSLFYNERYLAYCRYHKKTPDEMMSFDRKRWPGGVMCGYVLWINEQSRKFKEIKPGAFVFDGLTDHKGFDDFLIKQVKLNS